MKTLINKVNPEIRITAPDITLENHCYCIWTDDDDCIIEFWEKDWTLVEEEPKKVNCPFDKGDCRYCTVQFCGAREENQIETRSTAEPVDLEKLALEKCPIQVAYLEGLKKGYELGRKGGNK